MCAYLYSNFQDDAVQGLGLAFAKSLAQSGRNSCLVLSSRSGQMGFEDLCELALSGCTSFVVQADAGDSASSRSTLLPFQPYFQFAIETILQ